MNQSLSGFRNFFEENDDSHGDFMQIGLGDELNIPVDKIKKSMESEPWFSSHFGLGIGDEFTWQKGSTWKIVKMDKNGVAIELVQAPREYLPGGKLKKTDVDKKQYWMSRKEFLDLFNRGWGPALQQQAGGGGLF